MTQNNLAAGLASQLDVLQSRVDLTRAESTELSGRLAGNVAVARLERAMGEGRPAEFPRPFRRLLGEPRFLLSDESPGPICERTGSASDDSARA